MAKRLNIPDDLQNSFQKLMQLVPENLHSDIDTHNIILVYLKAGGEKMARHGVEIINLRYFDEIEQENEDYSSSDAIEDQDDASLDPDEDDDDLDDDDLDDEDADDYSIDF